MIDRIDTDDLLEFIGEDRIIRWVSENILPSVLVQYFQEADIIRALDENEVREYFGIED